MSDMIYPVLNKPILAWYDKRNHVRIPKRAESKKYLDQFYVDGSMGQSAPVFTASSITGSGAVGVPLVAHYTVTGSPTPVVTFQWTLDGFDIDGATSNTILPLLEYVESSLTCVMSATNTEGDDETTPTEVLIISPPMYLGGMPSSDQQVNGVAMSAYDTSIFFYLPFTCVATLTAKPSWMTVSSAGVISPAGADTPDAVASTTVTVRYTNAYGYVEQSYLCEVIDVATAPAYLGTFAIPIFTKGVYGSYSTIEHYSGTGPFTMSATGLPPGMAIDSGSGLISGTPSEVDSSVTTIVNAENAVGDADGTLTSRVQYNPTYADTSGGGYLAYDGAMLTDSTKFTMAFVFDGSSGWGTLRRLYNVDGRCDIYTETSTGKLNLDLESTTNGDYRVRWKSTASVLSLPGPLYITIIGDLDVTTPTFKVYLNGVLDAGSFVTGPLGGTAINWGRTGGNPDHSAFAFVSGSSKLVCKPGYLFIETGYLRSITDFWANGVPVDPADVDTSTHTPQVWLFGSDLTTGNNRGTGPDYVVTGGTIDLVIPSYTNPITGFVPRSLIGWGSATTGGLGGPTVNVTSLSNNIATSGSIRWALAQFTGSPINIVWKVEGYCNCAGTELQINRDNVTIDCRQAPGKGGGIYGARLSIRGSNIFIDSMQCLGNTSFVDGNADSCSVGVHSSSTTGTNVCEKIYFRKCTFLYGRDEVLSFYPRANGPGGLGQSTGNQVRYVTVEECIVGKNSYNTPILHQLGTLVGDGCSFFTFKDCHYCDLGNSGSSRGPAVRKYATDIEIIDESAYNITTRIIHSWPGAGTSDVGSTPQGGGVDIIGFHVQLGPVWSNNHAIFGMDTGSIWYYSDLLVNSLAGKTNTAGISDLSSPQASRQAASSGVSSRGSANIKTYHLANMGTRCYSNSKPSCVQDCIDEYNTGTGPSSLQSYPATLPSDLGDTYPANTGGVPNSYLAFFPLGTDPDATIAEGGPWDGWQEHHRISAYMVEHF